MTEKQRKWLKYYKEGKSGEEAAKLAGYGSDLKAISRKNKARLVDPLGNIRDFWESVINDEEISIQHRLKASELRLKLKENEPEEDRVVVIIGEDDLEN